MKVLFISNDPQIFLEESSVRARMRLYATRIGELHILSRAPRTYELHEEGLHLYGVRGGKLTSVFTLIRMARRCIAKNNIEVVSAQDPFEHGWIALQATKGTAAALHVQIHTDFLSRWFTDRRGVSSFSMRTLNKIRVRLADTVLPHAHGIRAVSKRIRDAVMMRFGNTLKTEPTVIPLSVPLTVPEKVPLPEPLFPFTLITVSRLEPEKRIEDILEAISEIHNRYPGVGLFVVGRGREEQRLKACARKLGIEANVRFLSEWRADAWGLMQSAHAFIQASAYEGYGRTLVEAALARVPIITTDVGIVGEVFVGFKDVLSIPPGDPCGLAAQIMGLVEDQQTRHTLIIHADQAARAHLASLPPADEAVAEDLKDAQKRRETIGV